MEDLKLNLPYFYGTETESFLFCKFPKSFFTDNRLKKMSSDAKLLFTFMLDRVALSIASDWRDDEGRVYIICTNEEACDLLQKSKKTISNAMSELGEGKFDLIERKKQGLGRPDLIFVKNLHFLTCEGEAEGENQDTKKKKTTQKSSGTKGKQGQKQSDLPENMGEISVENPVNNTVDNFCQGEYVPPQSSNIYTSGGVISTTPEVQVLPPIKTDITNNEKTKNELFRPTSPPSPQPTFPQSEPIADQGEDGWQDLDKEEKLYLLTRELEQAQRQGKDELASLFYDYRLNENKMELALYILTYMEESEENPNSYDEYSKTHFHFRLKKIYARALLEMLTGTYTSVRGARISYSKVIEKLVEHIEYSRYEYRVQFDSIMGCTISAYAEANENNEISSFVPYMKSCIWTTLCEGNIRHEANFQRMYG